MNIIGYLLTGAAAAALVKLIDNIIQWCLQRKAKKEDMKAERKEQDQRTTEQRLKDMERNINGLHGNGDLDSLMEAVNDLPLKK